EDDQAGDPRRVQGDGGQPGGQGQGPPDRPADVAAPDDGGGADRRRGGDQPDPLRGRAQVRRRQHARPAGGGQGRRRDGAGDPRRGRQAPGRGAGGAAAGTRLVSAGAGRPGNPGET